MPTSEWPERSLHDSTLNQKNSSDSNMSFLAGNLLLTNRSLRPIPSCLWSILKRVNGESMVLIQGEETRCLSNVCTHRGMRLALEPCTKKNLQCRYHGRTFNLDGTFRHMAEFEQAIDFPSDTDNLKNFPLKQWMGMYFTAQEEVPDLPWAMLEERLGFLKPESFTHDASRDRDHSVEANWLLYVDNFLEGFHIPYVHPELNQALDYSGYVTETFDGGVLQIGKAMEGDVKFDLPKGHPDEGQDIAAYYLWLFPNMMFNFYPWGLSVNVVIPVSHKQCRILYRGYVSDAELASQGAGSVLDTVEHQDQWVIEEVQLNAPCQPSSRSSEWKSQTPSSTGLITPLSR